MQKTFFPFVFFLTFQLIYGQNKNDKNVELIKSVREASNQAIAKHDIDGISKFWVNDFVQIRGNSTYLSGNRMVQRLWELKGLTVVFIEHDMDIVFSIAQHVVVLSQGARC